MLNKLVARVFIPGTPGVPADPGRPAIPAWTEVIPASAQVPAASSPSLLLNAAFTPVWDPLSLSFNYVQVAPGTTLNGVPVDSPASSGTPLGGASKPQDVVVYHPAQPAIPPTPAKKATVGHWRALNGLAWDSGAYSIKRLDGDLETTFSVPQVVGVIVGFASIPTGQNYRRLTHALYFATNQVQVMESGLSVGPSFIYAPSDTFTLRRTHGVVTYLKNGQLFATSNLKSVGSLIVEAVLYGALDAVI